MTALKRTTPHQLERMFRFISISDHKSPIESKSKRSQHWWCGLKTLSQLGHFSSWTSWCSFEKFPLLWNLRILFVNFSAQSSQFTSIDGYKSSTLSSKSCSLSCSLSISSQLLSLSMVSHCFSGGTGGTGVKTKGAGEGRPFGQGEMRDGEFSGKGELLRISFSGDSISFSST